MDLNFNFFTAYPKSPFERELQRLLSESAKNKILAVNKTNNLDTTSNNKMSAAAVTNNNNNGIYASKKATSLGSSSSNENKNNNNNNNNSIKTKDMDESIDSDSLKHPVGLEAIKEMARNRNIEIQR